MVYEVSENFQFIDKALADLQRKKNTSTGGGEKAKQEILFR